MRKNQIMRGKSDKAIAFANDSAALWEETYGTKLTWGFEIGSNVGTLYWFADHANLADFETQMMASMNNDETNKLLSEAVDLFMGAPHDKIIVTMNQPAATPPACCVSRIPYRTAALQQLKGEREGSLRLPSRFGLWRRVRHKPGTSAAGSRNRYKMAPERAPL